MAFLGCQVSTLFVVFIAVVRQVSAQIHLEGGTHESTLLGGVPDIHYDKVIDPTLKPLHLADLPGFTRSVYERDHALITTESQVYGPLPGWKNTIGAYLITPAMGAQFVMYIAQMQGNSSSASPSPDVERLVFVVKGDIVFTAGSLMVREIKVDGYAYIPPLQDHEITSSFGASILVVERIYSMRGAPHGSTPEVVVGVTSEQPLIEVPGEVFALRKLLPTGPAYDFNIHIMDFQPGEYLNVKEVHYNQHGLILLEGRGIYRLAEKWYPVQAGDAIWMAPFVPQWYAALGKDRSRYFLYKDVNRDPLLHL